MEEPGAMNCRVLEFRHQNCPNRHRPARVVMYILMHFALFAPISPACVAASTGDLEKLRARALELVNRARREQGLQPLELGPKVNEAALSHARDMLRRNYYSHTSPEGETVQDRYVDAGGSKWRLIAENIARCAGCTSDPDTEAVERLHRGWMNSPEHRHNILHRGLTRFGFGIVSSSEQGEYAVETFAGPGIPRGAETAEPVAVTSPGEQTKLALSQINRARAGQDRSPLESNPDLIDVAKSIMSSSDSKKLEIDQNVNPYRLLPSDQRRKWQSISYLVAACGGCGTEPTRADVRYFTQQWLDSSQDRPKLLASTLTHVGLALGANGDGKKVALLILGRRR